VAFAKAFNAKAENLTADKNSDVNSRSVRMCVVLHTSCLDAGV
jgi:hypothetical protein